MADSDIQQQSGGDSAADVANAKNRNLSLSQLATTLSSNSTSLVAKLTAIATAITQKMLGGVVGTSANRLLRTKTVSSGSSAGSVQNSTVICDDSGNLSGVGNLDMSGTLTAATLNPTNPLAINKGGTAHTTASSAFDALAPTTTTGDIILYGSGTNGRLAIGSTGQVPTVSGGTLVYATPTQEFFTILSADYTLTNGNTAQKAFNASTNGAFNASASTTYQFEALYLLTNTGVTNHTWSVLFGGTATFTSGAQYAQAASATSSGGTASVLGASNSTPGTALLVTNLLNSATEFTNIWHRGVLRVNGAGTIIPQLKLSAAPGGVQTILANSYIRLWTPGDNTVTTGGTWT